MPEEVFDNVEMPESEPSTDGLSVDTTTEFVEETHEPEKPKILGRFTEEEIAHKLAERDRLDAELAARKKEHDDLIADAQIARRLQERDKEQQERALYEEQQRAHARALHSRMNQLLQSEHPEDALLLSQMVAAKQAEDRLAGNIDRIVQEKLDQLQAPKRSYETILANQELADMHGSADILTYIEQRAIRGELTHADLIEAIREDRRRMAGGGKPSNVTDATPRIRSRNVNAITESPDGGGSGLAGGRRSLRDLNQEAEDIAAAMLGRAPRKVK